METLMQGLNELNSRGFLVVNDVVPTSWTEQIKLALKQDGQLDVTGKAASTMPDLLQLLYQNIIEPLVTETLGYSLPVNEWQSSTKSRGFPGEAAPHIDGQGYISRGGTWNRLPGFRLLIGLPLSDVVSVHGLGGLLGIDGGHVGVRNFFLREAPRYFHPDGSCKLEVAKECSQHLTGALDDELTRFGSVPMLGLPGSVTLASSLTPHLVDENQGPERTVVYFRVGSFPKPGLAAFVQPKLF